MKTTAAEARQALDAAQEALDSALADVADGVGDAALVTKRKAAVVAAEDKLRGAMVVERREADAARAKAEGEAAALRATKMARLSELRARAEPAAVRDRVSPVRSRFGDLACELAELVKQVHAAAAEQVTDIVEIDQLARELGETADLPTRLHLGNLVGWMQQATTDAAITKNLVREVHDLERYMQLDHMRVPSGQAAKHPTN